MNTIDLPPFYAGQKIVCIQDVYSLNGFYQPHTYYCRKGEIFTVLDMKKCCLWRIDISKKLSDSAAYCPMCHKQITPGALILWIDARFFRAVEENFQAISLEKVIEQETVLVNVN